MRAIVAVAAVVGNPLDAAPELGVPPDAAGSVTGTTTGVVPPAEAATVTAWTDAATDVEPSDAVTWHEYAAPGVSPLTVIGELVPVAWPVTPPVLEVHVTV